MNSVPSGNCKQTELGEVTRVGICNMSLRFGCTQQQQKRAPLHSNINNTLHTYNAVQCVHKSGGGGGWRLQWKRRRFTHGSKEISLSVWVFINTPTVWRVSVVGFWQLRARDVREISFIKSLMLALSWKGALALPKETPNQNTIVWKKYRPTNFYFSWHWALCGGKQCYESEVMFGSLNATND